MYLATCTRPDISYAVRELARFMSNYGRTHFDAAKRVCRYLNGSRSLGLIFGRRDEAYPLIRGFCDSDWGMGEDRKSISGYAIEVFACVVAWSSKQQTVIALSSCEAEYLSATHAAKQIIWTRALLEELGEIIKDPTILFCDNQGTICCSRDPANHSKMKHIDLRYHFIRWCVNNLIIEMIYIAGTDNFADLFTKPLAGPTHNKWLVLMNIRETQPDDLLPLASISELV
jgi:hypothetical protein